MHNRLGRSAHPQLRVQERGRHGGRANWRKPATIQHLHVLTTPHVSWLEGSAFGNGVSGNVGLLRRAAEQGDAADEAGASDGASQLIPGVRRTYRRTMRSAVVVMALVSSASSAGDSQESLPPQVASQVRAISRGAYAPDQGGLFRAILEHVASRPNPVSPATTRMCVDAWHIGS